VIKYFAKKAINYIWFPGKSLDNQLNASTSFMNVNCLLNHYLCNTVDPAMLFLLKSFSRNIKIALDNWSGSKKMKLNSWVSVINQSECKQKHLPVLAAEVRIYNYLY